MNSKDKETKTIQEKLKQFFRLKGATGNLRNRVDFSITEDIEKDIRRDAAISTRTKAIKELSDNVLNNRLEDRAIEKLWHCLEDLLHRDQPKEYRHLTFTFFRYLVQGQYERLGIMRAHFFRVIKQHDHPEDTVDRFELLSTLTLNGKEIVYFEEEVGPFLLNWMPEITLSGKTVDYLALLVNLVKFNAAYLDEEVITGFVQGTCYLCCRSAPEQNNVVSSCLQLLETVVAYSTLPTESLCNFVVALCRTVNYEEYCQNSWRIMRNLLGTHMGHSALYTMCRFLQDQPCSNDYLLLRGAVFHVNQALWGTQPVVSLHCTPTSILPSFIHALRCEHPFVVYEVMLSVQGLVDRRGSELHDPAWDVLLDIIKAVIVYVGSNTSVNSLVAKHLHETLCSIERLMEQGKFNGSVPLVYELIESCAHARPESSVLRLVNYLAEDVVPTKHMWLSKLNTLLQRYYRQETRTNVRLMVLDILTNVVKLNRSRYEDEIIERIVVPYLQNVASDPDSVVRNSCAKLLVELCLECDSKRCGELLDILDKILNRPYEVGNVEPISDSDLLDVKEVVCGLIKLFTIKVHRLPSSHAVRIYKMLVVHLENHYARPNIIENGSLLRYKIFDCFLNVRANSSCQLGCRNASGAMQYSPYLCVMSGGVPTSRGPVSPPPPAPASPAPSAAQPTQAAAPTSTQSEPATSTIQVLYVSLRHAFKVFITCLTQEKDWEVLHLVLSEIPKVMQNKALVLSKHGAAEIDQLATALCSMLTDKSLCLPESLRNTPKLSRSDFHQCVLPALASLASYHMYLDPACQQRIIRCMMKFGLVPRCSQQCITELTTCVLEMQEVMVKLLPEVLLDLSKISATVHIAVPVLEFLSTLTRLPTVFANFVGDQYMAVFAISLPYTNPFKYNHYIVSLAHHVIAVWFLKCRLPFRKDFVKFITTGLQTNTLIPFEETNVIRGDLMHMNEDSSNRKRSSSLTEQGSRRRPATSTAAMDLRPPVDKALHTFYEELTETCIDLMARYTFSPCSALPKRLPTTEFLLSGGQSMSWILGNKIITVTTSGCAQKPLRHGLCDKCWLMCQRTPDVDHCLLNRSSSGGDRDESTASSGRATRQNSGEQKSATDTSPNSPVDRLDQLTAKLNLLKPAPDKQLCSCWCQGWAEIHVRRPTGDISWVTRIQNQIAEQVEFPLNDVSSLFLPTLVKEPSRDDPDMFNNDSDRGPAKISRSGSGASNITSNTTVSTTVALNITTPTVCVAGSATTSTVSIAQSNIGGTGVTYKHETGAFQASVPTHLPVSTCATSVVPALSCEVSPGQETFHGPSSGPISIPDSRGPSRQSSHDSDDCETCYYEDGTRARNPVRRSNSSPEMSASWKNPFMTQTTATGTDGKSSDEGTIITIECDGQKKSKKDMRVSCEAIPEEISGLGTTPPSQNTSESQHPSLLTCHSCPGDAGTTNVINLSTKPPQSPTQTSPALSRRSSEQKISPIDKPPRTDKKPDKPRPSLEKTDASIPPMRRDRGHTISVMSPVSKPRLSDSVRRTGSPRPRESAKSGMNPSFVFLQLYHSAHFSNSSEKPLLVGSTQMIQRTVKVLDRMPPYETHKIGVVYVGPGQCNNETEILRNKFGSVRYVEFLQRLGTLISLREADPLVFFLGGLAQDGNDGNFAYIWQDDVMQVIFHVATLMPSKESDPSCNDKKLHIGNNYVSIIYNESGEDFNIGTIKSQLNYANIIIQPLDYATNRVLLKVKEELSDYITHTEPKIISDQNLAIMARQMALHANLASMVSRSIKAQGQNPYASNWLERLRKIKHLRARVTQEQSSTNSDLYSSDDVGSTIRNKRVIQDFTEYT